MQRKRRDDDSINRDAAIAAATVILEEFAPHCRSGIAEAMHDRLYEIVEAAIESAHHNHCVEKSLTVRAIAPLSLKAGNFTSGCSVFGFSFCEGMKTTCPLCIFDRRTTHCKRVLVASPLRRIEPQPDYMGELVQVGDAYRLFIPLRNDLPREEYEFDFIVEWMADEALCGLCPLVRPYLFPSAETSDDTPSAKQ